MTSKQQSVEEAIRNDLTSRVREKVKAAFETFSAARDKFQRLEKAAEDYETQKQNHHSTLGRLISESMNNLGKGGRPKDKEIAEAKANLVETETWLSRIQEEAIPQSIEEVSSAQEALKSALREAIESVKQEWTERMAELIDRAMTIYDLWIDQANDFYRSLGVNLNAGSLGEIPTIGRSCPRLEDYLSRVSQLRGYNPKG